MLIVPIFTARVGFRVISTIGAPYVGFGATILIDRGAAYNVAVKECERSFLIRSVFVFSTHRERLFE